MASSSSTNQKAAERTVRQLMSLGFPESRAREAVGSVGDVADVQLAMNWLLDHGEEDKGGAVEFKHCPHVELVGGFHGLVKSAELGSFTQPCADCGGLKENWHCLLCNTTRCGRYVQKHGLQHWEETRRREEAGLRVVEAAAGKVCLGHCLALSWSDLSVWCYECNGYVQHEVLEPLLKRARTLKFGEEEEEGAAASSGGAAGQGSSRSGGARGRDVSVGDPLRGAHAALHGSLGDEEWAAPRVLRACAEEARPGYRTMRAHEYTDEPEVLRVKVRKLAELVRRSARCVAYTGAGISTASGISDYASKAAGDSSSGRTKKNVSPWAARPTLAHRVLVALHRAGHLKHWVQQNHDGLPQKAGFPQQELNEIHGAWFDPSNPVVPMSGTLRADLIERMAEWEEKVDLCLALGTSMVGMNADRMAIAPATRARRDGKGLGTVIVSLQQTQYDSLSSLRVFATIDRVMELLCEELELGPLVPPPEAEEEERRASPPGAWPEVLTGLPYGADGRLDRKASMRLDLRPGSRLRLANQPSWDKERWGEVAEVIEPQEILAGEGHICLRLGAEAPGRAARSGGGRADEDEPTCLRVLGRWWLEAAQKGAIETIPVLPLEP